MSAYLGLFFVALLAATLLPAHSEIAFAGLLLQGYDPLGLWLAASTGNTLGSVVNWCLGRFLLQFQDRRWFPLRREKLGSAQGGSSAMARCRCYWPGCPWWEIR